jgi:hypothetical protein
MRPTEPQTLVIPRRNAPEPTRPPTREMTPAESQTMVIPPRSVPQEPEPTVSRDPGDETIFRPFSSDPKKDR